MENQNQKEEKSLVTKKLEKANLTSQKSSAMLDGFENVSQTDIATPIYILAQPTSSTYGEEAGNFVDRGTGISQGKIECILLKLLKARNFWPKPFNPNDERICYSKDNLYPADEVENPPSAKCTQKDESGRVVKVCPHSKFDGNKPPDCKITYTFLAYDLNFNTPFLISFKGKSLSPVKQLINQFLRKQKPIYSSVVTIKALKPEELNMQPGQYFIAQFETEWVEEPKELESLKSLYNTIVKSEQRTEPPSEESKEKPQIENNNQEQNNDDEEVPF